LKLHVLWLDPPPIKNPGIETLFAKMARRTGGAFYFTKGTDFLQDGAGNSTDTRPFTEMQQVQSEVCKQHNNKCNIPVDGSASAQNDTYENTLPCRVNNKKSNEYIKEARRPKQLGN
jgi:hypothetical protein